MVELHGWITLRESYESHSEEDRLKEIVTSIEQHIEKMNFKEDEIRLRHLNGVPNISIALYKNRETQEVRDVYELLKLIAKLAEGSYGLIYYHDDEDSNGKDNEFQVHILAQGIIKEGTDKFLSPLIPTVEK